MYCKIFFLTLLFIPYISSYSQWESIEMQVQTNLNSVFFLDTLNGWIVGEDSTILHTSNGGLDWVSQPSGFSGSNNSYNDVFFTNDTLGWIVGGLGNFGIILHSPDGGKSWVKQSDEIRRLNSVCFINDTVGWIGGGWEYPGGKIILKTSNRGLVWDTLLIEDWTHSIFDIEFVNENIGWAVGGVYPGWGNIIMKTTNGGDNWVTQLEDFYAVPIASCSFVSEQFGWISFANVILDPIGIMYTTDGGIHWNVQYRPANVYSWESYNSIIFVDENTGWAAGSRYDDFTFSTESIILHTSNGGIYWQEQNVTSTTELNSIFFINENEGWVVGDSGTVLHTTTGGQIYNEVEIVYDSMQAFDLELSQNYPNPFNPTTTIKYSIPTESFVRIKIYNLIGEEVATLVNEEKTIGNYEVEFNATSLPSGIYFYQLKAGKFVETKKMVLMK
jgi:photosystem II stability/assembly factor-like uncharacterized protein